MTATDIPFFVAASLAVAFVTIGDVERARAQPSQLQKTIRYVWTGPPPADLDDTWAVSPDGVALAYRDERSQMTIRNLVTGDEQPLGDELPASESRTRMVWSNDSRQLAYGRSAAADRMELRVVSRETRNARIVTESRSYLAPLAWSPDGTRLLIALEEDADDVIAWVTLATGAVQRVKHWRGSHRNEWHPKAVISPDGSQIAYAKVSADSQARDVFLTDAEGANETVAVEHPADDYPIAWTPSGQLLFASDRAGQIDLWALPVTEHRVSGIASRIHRDLGMIRPLGLTAAGALYYALNLSMTDVYLVGLDTASGRVQGPPRPIAARFVGNNSAPDIAPDGQRIVYQVGLPGTGLDLVFQSLRDRAQCVLHPKLQQFSRPRFDPARSAVVVHGIAQDGRQGVFAIDDATGDASLVASTPPSDLANPTFTRDGRALFYESDERAVWRLDRETNQTREVYRFAESARNFTTAPSPDGRLLAVVHEASLHLVDVESGTAREIVRVRPPERLHDFPGSLAWLSNGQHIIFGKTVGDRRALWRVASDGTGLQSIGIEAASKNIYFLRVSQDGRWLVFVMGDYDVRPLDVWVMEHFLP